MSTCTTNGNGKRISGTLGLKGGRDRKTPPGKEFKVAKKLNLQLARERANAAVGRNRYGRPAVT